jgi:hypothetical protein
VGDWLLSTVDVRALGGVAVAASAVPATVDDARDRLDAQVAICHWAMLRVTVVAGTSTSMPSSPLRLARLPTSPTT